MTWLAEHADKVYFLLGFAAIVLVGVWWIQRQIVYLLAAGGMLVGLLGAWLVLRDVVTDAKQIEINLKNLSQAILKNEQEKALSYVANHFKYKNRTAEKWFDQLREWIDDYQIDDVQTKDFEVKDLSRAEKHAKVHFQVEGRSKRVSIFTAECTWEWELAGEAWQVKKVSTRKFKDAAISDEK